MYDFIGDIHGHYDKLIALLEKLDYVQQGDQWIHPDGRQPFFLGDYIDRGPQIPQVLQLVFAMCAAGRARAIMGNHELNALAWATPRADADAGSADRAQDSAQQWCRPHTEKNRHQHAATLQQLDDAERAYWIEQFRGLAPFYENSGDAAFRAVHACWHPAAIQRVAQAWQAAGRWSDQLIRAASVDKSAQLYQDCELIMKGLEVPLPDAKTVPDKAGVQRNEVRAQWWRQPASGESIGSWMMPPREEVSDPAPAIPEEQLAIPTPDAPICFIGHYWMPPTETPQPIHPKVACIDFSVGLGGNLCAYRFDGESVASADNMVVV